MAANLPTVLTKPIRDRLIQHYSGIQTNFNSKREELRSYFLEIDKNYSREKNKTKEHTRAKAANKAGDSNRYQDITVPVVKPQVESAVVYQTSVFLTGHPLFGVVASPKFMEEALQLETVIEENARVGGWERQFILSFRDGFKYNFAPMEVVWVSEVSSDIVTDLSLDVKEGLTKEVLWSGNKIKRLDPYNTFVDPRVAPAEVHSKGEFAGYTERMSRIELKQLIASLPSVGKVAEKEALSSGSANSISIDASNEGYYKPIIGDKASATADNYWDIWAGLAAPTNSVSTEFSDYEVTTVYLRIIPKEFNIAAPSDDIPRILKLIIVNHKAVLYAEMQTNAHNMIPILVGQPNEDGLDYQTNSLAEDGVPFQQLASALMAANVAAKRRAVTDRVLYDPSRISPAHINSDNPSAKIPVRPSAHDKTISSAVYQFPYKDDQSAANMQQISTVLGLANTLNGQNQAQQGQFVKGNKTLHEFESVMQNANGRDQLASILLEHQVMMPIKQILKFNILQYQGSTEIYNRDADQVVEIDPVALRKSVLNFKVSDGLIPSSKLINGESLATAMQVIGSSPQIAQGYNIAPMFSYLMKSQGAKISDFEKSPEQIAYEDALGKWQQLMQLALEKGASEETMQQIGSQPLPEQFNYNPSNNQPAPKEAQSPTGSDTGGIL